MSYWIRFRIKPVGDFLIYSNKGYEAVLVEESQELQSGNIGKSLL